MKLFVTALNSGSNGNCYYIGNKEEAVLIDAGISCREIEQRMKRLNLNIQKVKALFITHEHTDHIKGADALSKKYKLPIYITNHTLSNARLNINNPHIVKYKSFNQVTIGNLEIIGFPKNHDAVDPHSFIVRYKEVCIGVFTDIGTVCDQVISHFKCCNAIFLEANYDEKMLKEGNYPYYLKNRISSNKGHLSNQQALDLFIGHKSSSLTHLFLSHISKENNDPLLVQSLFKSHSKSVNIVLTSRVQETPIYEIGAAMVHPFQLTLQF